MWHSKSLQIMLIRAASGTVTGRILQELPKYAHQGAFWAVFGKAGQNLKSQLIKAPFGQFSEGNSKSLQNMLIRAPFGQFLEGYGKILLDTLY